MLKKDIHIESLYTELKFSDRFAAAKNDGFGFVELWGWEDKDLPEVKKLLEKNDLKISVMSGDGPYSMCDPVNKKVYIDYIKEAIKAAKAIGCPTLVIHSDSLEDNPQFAKPMSGDYSDLRRWCAMFDVLRIITPLAEDEGITFVLEALNTVKDHCGNFLASTAASVDLVSAVSSPNLKILYDAYHMYLNEGKICETVEKYLPYIGHIHIADAPSRCEPGTGVINYKNFLEYLEKLDYKEFAGFELYASNNTAKAIKAIKNCF
ncbi:TIM barrel protein [Pectinatus haikarae]|uniref:TIM barrel protein n=1 Tax=Pectinatus haikarae TaxID=349096 RepID=UPI0018C489D0|nr:TIM barrel protein [Pectinatus haikarae]